MRQAGEDNDHKQQTQTRRPGSPSRCLSLPGASQEHMQTHSILFSALSSGLRSEPPAGRGPLSQIASQSGGARYTTHRCSATQRSANAND